MLFQRVIPKPASLDAAKEELHGIIVRAGYRPVSDITAIWQPTLFDEGDDALVFAEVERKPRCHHSRN